MFRASLTNTNQRGILFNASFSISDDNLTTTTRSYTTNTKTINIYSVPLTSCPSIKYRLSYRFLLYTTRFTFIVWSTLWAFPSNPSSSRNTTKSDQSSITNIKTSKIFSPFMTWITTLPTWRNHLLTITSQSTPFRSSISKICWLLIYQGYKL